ncbi:MAG: class I SAM-dependent DNA methyltransferase [Elusimicrobiota bacterium]|nr:class I SAM-dependent DNA methyltransferase [Elusimicrobiota bacterium]
MTEYIKRCGSFSKFKADSVWTILTPIEESIRKKIEKAGTPLKEWDISINYGIKTGCNEAFIITKEKRDELIEKDAKSAQIICPILRGKDIKRYDYKWAELYLLFIPWHFPLQKDTSIQGASKIAEKNFKENYPAVYNHLLSYKDKLKKRNQAETGIRYEWYALQRWGANYLDDFSKQKIVYPCIMANEPSFAFDNKKNFIIAPANIISGNHLQYLLAFLCSNLCYFALRKYYMGGGIEGELKTNRLLLLPVPLPKNNIERKIKALLEEKKYKEINNVIYNSYNLSREEIDFIDDKQIK